MTETQPIERTDHDSGYGRWTLFRRRPSAALAPYVHEMQGYFEEGGEAVVRRKHRPAWCP